MRLVLLTTLTIGCISEVDVNVDPDADGLTDAEEAELGTDRVVADSDGDGFDDGDEAAEHTDPLDALDLPYDMCRDDITGTGGAVGDIAFDFDLPNQWETTTRLYNYCDRVALLIFAGMWWGSCQVEAGGLEARYQTYREDGFVAITLLGGDLDDGDVELSERLEWAETYGLTTPVVNDYPYTTMWNMGGNGGLPWQVLVGRGGEIVEAGNFIEDASIEAALEE